MNLHHIPVKVPSVFEAEVARLSTSPSMIGGWLSVPTHIPVRVPAVFKAAPLPKRLTIQKWRRAVILPHKPVRVPLV